MEAFFKNRTSLLVETLSRGGSILVVVILASYSGTAPWARAAGGKIHDRQALSDIN